jgi:hypothetical protein
MELDATGLEGPNQKLLQLQTKFETLMKSATDGLEVDASAIAATASTDITAAVGELRTLTEKLPELPDVNLQSQLSSLSGLIPGSGQHTQALADITTKFGSALTTSGFSLDTLVSDASSAIGAGTSLSASIPNFELPAAGGDAIQKAIVVLQANPIKPEDLANIAEKVSDLVESPNFKALKTDLETTASTIAEQMKTIDVSGLQLPTDTVITLEKLISDTENEIRKLPTVDDKFYSPTEEFTEVAFQFTLDPGPASIDTDRKSPGALGGRVEASNSEVTTTKITTPEGATTTKKSTEKIVSGGGEHVREVSKKANISKHGFSHRPVEITELFYEGDVTVAEQASISSVSDFSLQIELKNDAIKILYVGGYVPTAKTSSGRGRILPFQLKPSNDVNNEGYNKGRWDLYKAVGNQIDMTYNRDYGPAADTFDTVDVDGATITRPHNHKGVMFRVTYQYADKYDPSVSKPPK